VHEIKDRNVLVYAEKHKGHVDEQQRQQDSLMMR
jgi:hypothetical protein